MSWSSDVGPTRFYVFMPKTRIALWLIVPWGRDFLYLTQTPKETLIPVWWHVWGIIIIIIFIIITIIIIIVIVMWTVVQTNCLRLVPENWVFLFGGALWLSMVLQKEARKRNGRGKGKGKERKIIGKRKRKGKGLGRGEEKARKWRGKEKEWKKKRKGREEERKRKGKE